MKDGERRKERERERKVKIENHRTKKPHYAGEYHIKDLVTHISKQKHGGIRKIKACTSKG